MIVNLCDTIPWVFYGQQLVRSDYPTLEIYRLELPGQTLGIAAPAVPKEDHADQLYNTVPLNKRAVKLMPKGVRGPLVEESSK